MYQNENRTQGEGDQWKIPFEFVLTDACSTADISVLRKCRICSEEITTDCTDYPVDCPDLSLQHCEIGAKGMDYNWMELYRNRGMLLKGRIRQQNHRDSAMIELTLIDQIPGGDSGVFMEIFSKKKVFL